MTHSIATAQQLIEGIRSKRAIIFARARSLPPGPEQESAQLEAQKQYCNQVAESLKAEVVEVYAVRGGTTDPVTQRMVKQLLDEVEVGGIDYVITQNLRSEEHTSELQSRENLVCRLLLEKKKTIFINLSYDTLITEINRIA